MSWDLDATRYAARKGGQHSMVRIGPYDLCISRVAKGRRQKEINQFVSEATESTRIISIIDFIMAIQQAHLFTAEKPNGWRNFVQVVRTLIIWQGQVSLNHGLLGFIVRAPSHGGKSDE